MEARPTSSREITRLLRMASRGDDQALERLMPVVYEDLRGQAAGYLSREATGHTLQPTALVHEAYLRLVDQRETEWVDRAHFFAVSATCMRRVLMDHARKRTAAKRGGRAKQVPLEDVGAQPLDAPERFLALGEAIEQLAATEPRRGKLAELRLFGGLQMAEVAQVLGVSLSTAEREWRLTRAWLAREIGEGAAG